MSRDMQAVISASRRTDIPAFYMPWFMDGIRRGYCHVTNPFNRRQSKVLLDLGHVHSIVFWSKNFGPFLEHRYGERLQAAGYHLFFNFTVNSASEVLEPNVPALPQRLRQLEELCRRFDPRAVNWRFDPVCFYATPGRGAGNNLGDFESIAGHAADAGVRRCVTSFMDDYAKIRRRVRRIPGMRFVDPDMAHKVAVIRRMHEVLTPLGIDLFTCCEQTVLDALPADTGIRPSSCIPGAHLMALYGGRVSLRKDAGQRVGGGCRCTASVDIGSYDRHPCRHDCLFCYANPVAPEETPS